VLVGPVVGIEGGDQDPQRVDVLLFEVGLQLTAGEGDIAALAYLLTGDIGRVFDGEGI
jgi:hypothetical protein